MELGRECLKLWGYDRVDEIIRVKTNQLQRIIRTGRTGHWINHGKEHCLVGLKGGKDMKLNRGLDCDVIVAEVRATSHKPDEIYGIIERLSPGTRYSIIIIIKICICKAKFQRNCTTVVLFDILISGKLNYLVAHIMYNRTG